MAGVCIYCPLLMFLPMYDPSKWIRLKPKKYACTCLWSIPIYNFDLVSYPAHLELKEKALCAGRYGFTWIMPKQYKKTMKFRKQMNIITIE